MARTDGIIQSIERAWRLVQQTGFMDITRGLNTEGWQTNLREAARELREAAGSLTARDNRDAYGALEESQRTDLWRAILAAQQTAIGVEIITELGVRYPRMSDDVDAAESALASRANGFPVRVLRHMAAEIRDAAPDRASVVERRAREAGDPPPRDVTREEAELYQRVVLRAMQLSDREASSYRSAGDAAFEAAVGALLPPSSTSAAVQEFAEGEAFSATLGEHGNTAGVVLSVLRSVSAGMDAHRRLTDDEYRLEHWVHQVCLQECDNNDLRAREMVQRLQDILQRLNAWFEWLQRHQDHPSYTPPGRTWRADPTASLDNTRPGSANRSGPVQGAVRGPSERAPTGMA